MGKKDSFSSDLTDFSSSSSSIKGKESSVVINGDTDETAVGALTLELVSFQPFSFDHYFNALTPDTINDNSDEDEGLNNHSTNEKSISLRNPWF